MASALALPGKSLSTWLIQENALKGLSRFEQSINDAYIWINEALAEAKKTFKTNEISMLPKTPSAPRRTRRRVPSIGGGARANLRSNANSSRDSVTDPSTEANLLLKTRRNMASKAENKASIDIGVDGQNTTTSGGEDDTSLKKSEKVETSIETRKVEEKNKNSALCAADQIISQHQDIFSKASERILKTAGAFVTSLSKTSKISAESNRNCDTRPLLTAPINAERQSSSLASTDISLSSMMQPVVVLGADFVQQPAKKGRVSEDEPVGMDPVAADEKHKAQAGDKRDEDTSLLASSRRSSMRGKATLNVARLSTSRRSSRGGNATLTSQISAKKSSLKCLAESSPVRCTRSKTRLQIESAVVATMDDSDCEIGDTPSPQRRLLQSKIISNKSALVANNNNDQKPPSRLVSVASFEPDLPSRATRSKTRVIENEESSSNLSNAAKITEFKKPGTPSTAKKSRPLGSKVQQLQEVLMKDSGFGLRASPKPSTPRSAVSNCRRSIKRAVDSIASEVTPKRMCQKRLTPEDAGNVQSTASKLRQTGSNSNLKVKKHTSSGNIPLTSFIQKSSAKILTQDELVEFKRSELAAKEKKMIELHQKRNMQQQKRIDELRRNREEHQRQVQNRRMEQEQSTIKKGSIQRPDPQDRSVVSSRDNIAQKEEEGVMRMLVEEGEPEQINDDSESKDVNNMDEEIPGCDMEGRSREGVEKENAAQNLQEKSKFNQKDKEKGDQLKMDIAHNVKEIEIEIRSEILNPLSDKAMKMRLEKEKLEKDKLERETAELARIEKEKKRREKQEKEEQRRLKREQDEQERLKRLIEQKEQQELDRKRQREERELKERLEKEKKENEKQQERELYEKLRQEKILAAERLVEERLANERSRLETERRLKETQKQTQELIDKHNENLKHNRGNSNNAMIATNKVAMVSISDVHNLDKGCGSGIKISAMKGFKISPNTTAKEISITSGGVAKAVNGATPATISKITTTTAASAAPTSRPLSKAAAVPASKVGTTTYTAAPALQASSVPGTTAPCGQHSKAFGVPVLSSVKTMNTTSTLNKTFEREGNAESYDMTPVTKKKFAASTADNYNIDDLNSEDSTDEEDKPRKKIPQWAQGTPLKIALIQQCSGDRFNSQKIFGLIIMPDLNLMFEKKRPRFNKRTSSAQWDEFSSFLGSPK